MRRSTRGQAELHETSRPWLRSPDARGVSELARSETPHPAAALQRITSNSRSLTGSDALALQGGVGNGAVQRMLSGRARSRPRVTAPIGRAADPRLPSDGAGRAMPPAVQAKMERAFATDLSGIRIHEGARATALGALAYTQGNEVHFAPGNYQPNTQAGQALLGHELTHAVQQRQGRVRTTAQFKGVGVNEDAGLEREADEAGARAARGELAMRGAPLPAVADRGGVAAGEVQAKLETAPIQRVVAPMLHRETAEANAATDGELRAAYDAAWAHLWGSAAARHIYTTVHNHPSVVHVKVGTLDTQVRRNPAGGGSAGGVAQQGAAHDWDMEWNPWYFGALTDQTRGQLVPTRAPNTASVTQTAITGTLSPAMQLLHEFGHVKQDIEAQAFGVGATQVGGTIMEMEKWIDNLGPRLVNATKAVNGRRGAGAELPVPVIPAAHDVIVEGDNVTRHEREVQGQLGEPQRADYANTVVFGDLDPLAKRMVINSGLDPAVPANQLPALVTRATGLRGGPALNPENILAHVAWLRVQFQRVLAAYDGNIGEYTFNNLNAIITHLGEAEVFWRRQRHVDHRARQPVNGAAPPAAPTFNNP